MARIIPFPGLRYDLDSVGDLSRIISPPYDKISSRQREILWHRSPHNAVRLILPPPGGVDTDVTKESTDSESADWYAAAAERFREWIRTGILRFDSPRFYVYRHSFPFNGTRYTRVGIFGALLLEDQANAHAHEFTFEGPKADRLRLTRAAQANLSSIFLLVDGKLQEWDQLFALARETLLHFHDLEDQEHELLAISADEDIRAASRFFEDRTLVIADGHHRYETALNYRREMGEKTGRNPDEEPWGKILVYLVPVESPGLLVLPTHRVLICLPDGWLERLRGSASAFFDMEFFSEISSEQIHELLCRPQYQSAIFVYSLQVAALFSPKPTVEPPAMAQVPEPIRRLNVSLLHHYFFSTCLGITPEDLQKEIRYIRGEEEAMSLVRSGSAEAAFLVCSISPKAVFEASLTGVRMPQKTTDFYPKIPTGLVMRSLAGSHE